MKHSKLSIYACCISLALIAAAALAEGPKPKRTNRAIELLEQGQPIYYTGVEDRSYEGGNKAAKTWADYITYEMEHGPFDVGGLHEFMRGLDTGFTIVEAHRMKRTSCSGLLA